MRGKAHQGFNDQNAGAREDFTQNSAQNMTQEQIDSLLFMIEEEKMARDLYDALYEQTGEAIFDKISNSEQKHYDSLMRAAQKLRVDTTEVLDEAGVFSNEEIQSLYDTLLLQGSISTQDAFDVGVAVENADIADLNDAIAQNDIVILGQVYDHLLNGSQHHLDAFLAV